MSFPDQVPTCVIFHGISCRVKLMRYTSGSWALHLHDTSGSHVARATPHEAYAGAEHLLQKDEVLIFSNGENIGMLKALQEAGFVEPTGRFVPGWISDFAVCCLHQELVASALAKTQN